MNRSNISWLKNPDGSQGYVWNCTAGCSPAGVGCANCWAESLTATRFRNNPRYAGLVDANGKWTGEVRCFEDRLRESFPKKSSTIFVCSQSDLFHEAVPSLFIVSVFKRMCEAANAGHTFVLLTKRADRMAGFARKAHAVATRWDLTRHIYWGVSCSTQTEVDAMVPRLLEIPGKHILSLEPLCERVSLREHLDPFAPPHPGLDLVIVGCDQAPKARRREMRHEWMESLYHECEAAGVMFFGKQEYENGKLETMPLIDGAVRQELPWCDLEPSFVDGSAI